MQKLHAAFHNRNFLATSATSKASRSTSMAPQWQHSLETRNTSSKLGRHTLCLAMRMATRSTCTAPQWQRRAAHLSSSPFHPAGAGGRPDGKSWRPLSCEGDIKSSRFLWQREREETGAAKQNKANKNTGLKGIETNKREKKKKLVHRYGTHISVIHYHNVARKQGPTGLEMGGRRLGESQEIADARDVGGKQLGTAFFFYPRCEHKKRGGFFRDQYATVKTGFYLANERDAQSTSEEDDARASSVFPLCFHFFLHSQLHTLLTPNMLSLCCPH